MKASSLYNAPLLAPLCSLLIGNSPSNTMQQTGCLAGILEVDLDKVTLSSAAFSEKQFLRSARKIGNHDQANCRGPWLSVPILRWVWLYRRELMAVCASPQVLTSGRHCSRYLRQAHFIKTSKKGLSEPSWEEKLTSNSGLELS